MLRDPSGANIVGDPRVGLPSADIPGGSLLEDLAAQFPSSLHRSYVTGSPSGVSVDEDGTVNSGSGFFWNYYRDGVFIVQYYYAEIDVTSPTLSAPQVSGVSAHGCIPSVITDESNGTLYVVVVPDADAPSDAQIKSGKQSSGANAIAARSVSVGHVGKHFLNAITNLSPSTSYEVYFLHSDSSGNDSDSVTVGFTTSANISGGTAIRYNAPINRFFRRR